MGKQVNKSWNATSSYFSYFKSVAEIVGLTACAAATGVAFYQINKLAGLIFLPYLAWLSFATCLNYSIYRLNTPAIEDKKPEKKD